MLTEWNHSDKYIEDGMLCLDGQRCLHSFDMTHDLMRRLDQRRKLNLRKEGRNNSPKVKAQDL